LLAYHLSDLVSDLHTLYDLVFVFCLFVLKKINKPFSDSLFCLGDDKGTYMTLCTSAKREVEVAL
jgi:hypothetical protein